MKIVFSNLISKHAESYRNLAKAWVLDTKCVNSVNLTNNAIDLVDTAGYFISLNVDPGPRESPGSTFNEMK